MNAVAVTKICQRSITTTKAESDIVHKHVVHKHIVHKQIKLIFVVLPVKRTRRETRSCPCATRPG